MGLESAVQGLLVAVLVGLLIAKVRAPKLKLPPGTVALPIVGNWLQVSYTLLLHSSIFTNLQLHSEHCAGLIDRRLEDMIGIQI